MEPPNQPTHLPAAHLCQRQPGAGGPDRLLQPPQVQLQQLAPGPPRRPAGRRAGLAAATGRQAAMRRAEASIPSPQRFQRPNRRTLQAGRGCGGRCTDSAKLVSANLAVRSRAAMHPRSGEIGGGLGAQRVPGGRFIRAVCHLKRGAMCLLGWGRAASDERRKRRQRGNRQHRGQLEHRRGLRSKACPARSGIWEASMGHDRTSMAQQRERESARGLCTLALGTFKREKSSLLAPPQAVKLCRP